MKKILNYSLLLLPFVLLLQCLTTFKWLHIPGEIMIAARWLSWLLLAFYGYKTDKSITFWIMLSMFIGAEIGYDFPVVAKNLQVLSKIFMKLIKCVIAPLLFGTLVVGIAGHSDMKQVGRMGVKALIYFEVVTTIALFIGLGAINFTKVGYGISAPSSAGKIDTVSVALLTAVVQADKSTKLITPDGRELNLQSKTIPKQDWQEIVLHTFPENIAKSIAEGQVLQIVVFCLLFAFGLTQIPQEKKRSVLGFCESLSEVMFKFTKIIMYFAPIGVGGAMAYTIGTMGIDIFKNLLGLVATLYMALVFFILGVLLPIALYIKLPIRKFLKAVAEPASLAFATASSEAALASAIKNMEEFGIPNKVVAFVLPTGYTFNLDGTTLYLSLASVFVAQAAGIEMSFGTQLVMVFTLMLTSKGVAGVARASLIILAGTASSFGLPDWPIAAILGVDALMDMARTSVNVIGNSLATVFVAWWEGEWEAEKA